MREVMRNAVIGTGVAAMAMLVLVAAAAVTGAWWVSVLTLMVGLALVIIGCVAAVRLLERSMQARDRLSTRVGHLENHCRELTEQVEHAEKSLSATRTALTGAERNLSEVTGRLERTGAAVEKQRGDHAALGADVVSIRADLTRTDSEVATATADHINNAASIRLLREKVKQLASDQDAANTCTARTQKDLQVLRRRVPAEFVQSVEAELEELKSSVRGTLRASFENAIQLGRAPRTVISETQAVTLFAEYLDRDQLLQLRPLIEHFELLGSQSLTTLRQLFRFYRRAGYWDLAALTLTHVHGKSGRETDARALAKIEHESELFSQPAHVTTELPGGDGYDPRGPILHMVGRVLPDTQTGYTLRTQYTVEAQARKGLPVAVVGQSGITDRGLTTCEHYVHGGIDYYLLPGTARNGALLADWLRSNMVQLADLVRKLRPSVLHAHSDFFNALIVDSVGTKYGIPTVYESRGFWEESWLSRTIAAHAWDDVESLFSMYGRPAAYELRKHAEETVRLLPDHIFTLAGVMRDHILESAEGAISEDTVSIVPNAVESRDFPVQERDEALAREIGLPEGAVTIGYISSMVEYEGIDTLIDAYHLASIRSSTPVCLLLVGDGDHLLTLRKHIKEQGIEQVYLTGRVPHEDVLRHYGLIDIFVVPRKPSAVADLVTPLKPFEAFSTGRAVVLSDVVALREIGRHSHAVETFQAGDVEDLARILCDLVENPLKRQELSVRGSSWVRNHGSWDGNVDEYYRVYKNLGYEGPATIALEAELKLKQRHINPGDLIDRIKLLPDPPLTGWFSLSEMKQTAQDILDRGWIYEEFEPIRIDSFPDWAKYGRENRSWGYNLHSWKFMEPLLREYGRTRDRFWLETALGAACDWLKTYRDEGAEEASADPMVWYDMALALRSPMLLGLLIQASRHADLRPQAVALSECLLWHVDKLHEDSAFNPNNNHGFYVAAAQLHLAKFGANLPGMEEVHTEGARRLQVMIDRQFADDGVHLEHSPDYHRMLLGSFERAIHDGLVVDETIHGRIKRASHVLGWMIQPNGRLMQFGDSQGVNMMSKHAAALDPVTLFLMTGGKAGTPPEDEIAVFEQGGYAFVRSPAPRAAGDICNSGYLAFSAAFHSRAHKHADDLNIVWYDQDAEILVDAGRYGYGELLPSRSPLRKRGFYYSSEERQYVESTIAHNTLMMDGADHERRDRVPYGSGIVAGVHDGGVFDLEGRVHHLDFIHRRRLVYTPGRKLVVKDSVFSQSTERREAVLWFNLDGEFELVGEREALVFERKVPDGRLRVEVDGPGARIDPVRGQQQPMRGWRSRRDRTLEAAWSIGFSFAVETRTSVETVFSLS